MVKSKRVILAIEMLVWSSMRLRDETLRTQNLFIDFLNVLHSIPKPSCPLTCRQLAQTGADA